MKNIKWLYAFLIIFTTASLCVIAALIAFFIRADRNNQATGEALRSNVRSANKEYITGAWQGDFDDTDSIYKTIGSPGVGLIVHRWPLAEVNFLDDGNYFYKHAHLLTIFDGNQIVTLGAGVKIDGRWGIDALGNVWTKSQKYSVGYCTLNGSSFDFVRKPEDFYLSSIKAGIASGNKVHERIENMLQKHIDGYEEVAQKTLNFHETLSADYGRNKVITSTKSGILQLMYTGPLKMDDHPWSHYIEFVKSPDLAKAQVAQATLEVMLPFDEAEAVQILSDLEDEIKQKP